VVAVTIAGGVAGRGDFRTVLHTAQHSQVVVMALRPGEDQPPNVEPAQAARGDDFLILRRRAVCNGA